MKRSAPLKRKTRLTRKHALGFRPFYYEAQILNDKWMARMDYAVKHTVHHNRKTRLARKARLVRKWPLRDWAPGTHYKRGDVVRVFGQFLKVAKHTGSSSKSAPHHWRRKVPLARSWFKRAGRFNYRAEALKLFMAQYRGKPCEVCGSRYQTVGHHLLHRSTHPHHILTPENIMVVCRKHHREIHEGGVFVPFSHWQWMELHRRDQGRLDFKEIYNRLVLQQVAANLEALMSR